MLRERELFLSNVNFHESKEFRIKEGEEGVDPLSTLQTNTLMLCVKTPV